ITDLRPLYNSFNAETEIPFVIQILTQAISPRIAIEGIIEALADGGFGEDVKEYVEASFTKNKISDSTFIFKLLRKKPAKLATLKDPFFDISGRCMQLENEMYAQFDIWEKKLDELRPAYVDAKMEANGNLFIPDANGTLRFTYGSIKGYNPADGVYSAPVSTLKGILEKGASPGEYTVGDKLKNAIETKNNGTYYLKAIESVPVNILYNTDTSGGNSGSPIMDKNGNLIGLNFDRAYEACVNDFAWNDEYSRSIGVDIRYILWVAENVDNAKHLVTEMQNH
ncbi:MAG: S46 family peptidase, partial [Bacteroidetes bacterium]|nr:S46 family peptidase [Bacteroidota bacterium]